jgi:hypothetical protein
MKKPPPSIDWKSLFNKLTAIAASWMVDRSVDKEDLMINGVSPKDFAQNATLVVLEEYHRHGRIKSEDDVYKIAYKVMWHDFLDLIGSAEYKRNERILEFDDDQSDKDNLGADDKSFSKVDDENSVKYYYSLANGDKDLIEFIEAVLYFDTYKREGVAELLGITPQEVTNRARKLRYRHSSKSWKTNNLEIVKT